MSNASNEWLNAGPVHNIPDGQARAVDTGDGQSIAVFHVGDRFYATDNQCPHRGYPLTRGLVRHGILTCDWHGRNFDLESGGCFNDACDDLTVFPVEIRDESVWIHIHPYSSRRHDANYRLLWEGLINDDLWTISKAVALLVKADIPETEIAEYMLGHLTRHLNILLDDYRGGDRAGDRINLLLSGLELARQYDGEDRLMALSIAGYGAVGKAVERLEVVPLPPPVSWDQIERWIRQFSRNAEGGRIERCLVTARHIGEEDRLLPLFYECVVDPYNLGEPRYFTTLSGLAELVEIFGWLVVADPVCRTGAQVIGRCRFDLAGYHRDAFEYMTAVTDEIDRMDFESNRQADLDEDVFVRVLTGKDIIRSFDAVYKALKSGVGLDRLISAFVLLAADRMARVPIIVDNKWATLTMEFKMAASLRRAYQYGGGAIAAKALFHAAWLIFDDRWINIPESAPDDANVEQIRISNETGGIAQIIEAIEGLQPDLAGRLTASYLQAGYAGDTLLTAIGRAILRDDTNQEALSVFRAVQQEWTRTPKDSPVSKSDHPVPPELLIGLARYAADIRLNKNNLAAVTAASHFAEGRTTVALFEP